MNVFSGIKSFDPENRPLVPTKILYISGGLELGDSKRLNSIQE